MIIYSIAFFLFIVVVVFFCFFSCFVVGVLFQTLYKIKNDLLASLLIARLYFSLSLLPWMLTQRLCAFHKRSEQCLNFYLTVISFEFDQMMMLTALVTSCQRMHGEWMETKSPSRETSINKLARSTSFKHFVWRMYASTESDRGRAAVTGQTRRK